MTKPRFMGALIAFVATAPSAAAADAPAWRGVYEGVIGKAHVVAALGPSGSRYFYAGQANDLGLIVAEANGRLRLTETLAPNLGEEDVKQHPDLVNGR